MFLQQRDSNVALIAGVSRLPYGHQRRQWHASGSSRRCSSRSRCRSRRSRSFSHSNGIDATGCDDSCADAPTHTGVIRGCGGCGRRALHRRRSRTIPFAMPTISLFWWSGQRAAASASTTHVVFGPRRKRHLRTKRKLLQRLSRRTNVSRADFRVAVLAKLSRS